MWFKIICHCLILVKNMIDVTLNGVFLIYSLIQDDIDINMGVVSLFMIKKACYYQGYRYGFSSC